MNRSSELSTNHLNGIDLFIYARFIAEKLDYGPDYWISGP